MSDISRQRLKRSITSALTQVDEMQQELAIVRAQCKILQEEMRAIRVRSKRSQIHGVTQDKSKSA
jgi:ABC-type phosphate transport system auxiliary subunit